ncbi:hypothetical protein PV328_006349 [Microctonus aethiopoides]|uniref:Origin recognition complex subunit 2 n=1 Tax=Microctonus aethiopoides TaxID=144406 RepID=A0AA39FP98_9HYME|nr:hypothetical protein PV328_006349 [Microctonus aethiopoides]
MAENNENIRRSTRIKSRINYSDSEDDIRTPRSRARGSRLQRTPKKISNPGEDSVVTPTKTPTGNFKKGRILRNRQRNSSVSSVDESPNKNIHLRDLEKQLEDIEEEIQKPSELFHDEDISGNRIYGFQTPSKKNAMVQKALSSRTPNTSKIISTPKSIKPLRIVLEKINTIPDTPNSARRKSVRIQELIKTRKRQVHFSSESESVSEDSEFMPSNSESSENETENENENDDEDEKKENETPKKANKFMQMQKVLNPITPCRRGRSKNNIVYRDYHVKTDEYFETQGEKIHTSDHTLGRLKTPRLDEQKLQELLKNKNHISEQHKKGICALADNYKSLYPMWHHIMEEGYSILLHGLGSKKNLIDNFHKEIIYEHPTLIINGFFPSLTIKDILDNIITELMNLDSPGNVSESFSLIEKVLNENPNDRLYLLIHNIDGTMLRSNKAQDMLSRLAAISNVRVMASVDHINTPLLWDNVKRSRYNFYWWDATTLMPYEAETSYESSLLVQRSGALALSSLYNVFASLTTNAKAIYTILVKYQLEYGKNNLYSGMAFKDLYRSAREAFLVSSDIALRAQLTEFIDHKLVKNKRHVDGAEYLIIPLENSLLQKFIDNQETN